MFSHLELFTHKLRLRTDMFKHRLSFAHGQKCLRTEICARTDVYAQKILHTEHHRTFYTYRLFTRKSSCTQKFYKLTAYTAHLHTEVLQVYTVHWNLVRAEISAQRSSDAEEIFRKDFYTKKPFDTKTLNAQKLLHSFFKHMRAI